MQSNYATNGLTNIQHNGKLLSMSREVILIVDVLLSSYFFFFNLNRTASTGFWTVLALQVLFLPILIVISLIENRLKYNWTIRSLGNPAKASFKQRLARSLEIEKEEANVYTNPNMGIMNGLKMGIFLLFAIDLIIILNFLFLGLMVDSIRGVQNGEVIIYYMILDQAYYLPPLLLMILAYVNLNGESSVDAEITKWNPDLLEQKRSKIKLLRGDKKLKRLMIASLLLFLLSFSIFAFANQSEDNQNGIIDIPAQSEYTRAKVWGLYPSGDNIQVFTTSGLDNGNGLIFTHLVLFTIDANSYKIKDSQSLFELDRRERIIDAAITADRAYLFTFNSLTWAYTLHEYRLGDDVATVSYTWDDDIDGSQDFIVNYLSFEYLLSPFDGGVHIIRTENRFYLQSLVSNTTVRTITDAGVTDTQLDLVVLDGLSANDQTYLLHHSPDQDNFQLTTFDAMGVGFANGANSSSMLVSQNSEMVLEFRTPNSATLFEANGNLYYRSTENVFDITNSMASPDKTELLTDDFHFNYRGLRGTAAANDILFVNSEIVIEYVNINSLERVQVAKGVNERYFGSGWSNMLVHENSLFSASDDGRLFVWDVDPQAVTDENVLLRNLIIAAVIVYLGSASIFFVLRRKLD